MGWEIKRYGGKIQPGGPGYSEFAEARFLTVVLLFLATVSSYMFAKDWYAELYLPLWFLYTLIGFIPELFKRLREIPIVVFSAFTLGIAHILGLHPFKEHIRKDGRFYKVVVDEPALMVFTVFSLLIIIACVVLMCVRDYQKNKYPDQENSDE